MSYGSLKPVAEEALRNWGGTSNGRSSFQQQNLHTLSSDIHSGTHLHMGSHESILKICITCCCEFDYASYKLQLAMLQYIVGHHCTDTLHTCYPQITWSHFVAINENHMWCFIQVEYLLVTSLIGSDVTFNLSKIHPSMCSNLNILNTE